MFVLLLQVVLSIPTMTTSGIMLGLFYAPALCLFWLTKHAVDSALLSGPGSVTAAGGGSATVPCQYDQQFRENTKYWCRGILYGFCTIVVKTPRNRENNRSSIRDDKEAGVFTVTITSLRKSDEDTYWCVIARNGKNVHSRVRLSVSPAVTTTATVAPTSPSPTQDEIRWWAPLRWILFISMLCCLVTTHVVARRMKTARKLQPHQQHQT